MERYNYRNQRYALSFLTLLLYKYYNQKVIVLIDEYDSPIISAYEKGYYTEMKDFLKAFYGEVLKTNDYLQMGVLTGIIKVAQAGIFSDLNNFTNYTILNNEYSNSFGLVENEVKAMLDDYYIMHPNMESGYGRADIIFTPRNKAWAGYILELKRANTNDIEKEAEKAFNQIEDKKYETLLKKNGVKDIVKIGLVFDGKKAIAYY